MLTNGDEMNIASYFSSGRGFDEKNRVPHHLADRPGLTPSSPDVRTDVDQGG